MKQIVAIGGEPGTGKTTLMKEILEKIESWPENGDTWHEKKYGKLVPYLENGNIICLGTYHYDEVFGGTDRMSMACQPEVIEFIDSLPDDRLVMFEGDRLFNSSFLDYCNQFDLSIYVLKATNLEERYKERGSDQNKTWLQGRRTKIANVTKNLDLLDKITYLENQTIVDMKNNVETIWAKRLNK